MKLQAYIVLMALLLLAGYWMRDLIEDNHED